MIMPQPRLANVLLVEDSFMDVDLTRELLAMEFVNMDLQVVCDGTEACDYFCKQGKYERVATPDLVFLDLSMPKMDGLQVLEFLGSRPGLKHIIVIVLSGSDYERDIAAAKELGAVDYIVKPLSLEAIRRVIKNLPHLTLIPDGESFSLCVL